MKQKIFYIFILLCVGILIYSNSLHGEFQFDDAGYILEDPHIRQFSTLWWEAGSWNIRFICLLSFALNYYFHKIDVFGYHLVNLIIHLLNALLIFASAIASGISSMPVTCFTLPEMYNAILPKPVYKSYTLSESFNSAKSTATSKSFKACLGLV